MFRGVAGTRHSCTHRYGSQESNHTFESGIHRGLLYPYRKTLVVAVLALSTDNIIFLFMAIVSTVVLGIFLARWAVERSLSGGHLPFNLIFVVGMGFVLLVISAFLCNLASLE